MSDTQTHFERLNAIVDGGWLKKLSPVELGILLVYLRHANADGIAWPGASRIARALGHVGTGHIREARASLVRRGMLSLISRGGGNDSSRYRVEIPTLPGIGAGPESGHAPNRDATLPGSGAGPLPGIGAPTLPGIGAPNNTLKGTDNKPLNRPRRGGESVEGLALPFQSDAFKTAWGEWQKHRREIRKPLTRTSATKQIQDLDAMGEASAIAAIERSITAGWQGIFRDRKQTTAPKPSKRSGEYQENIVL